MAAPLGELAVLLVAAGLFIGAGILASVFILGKRD
jgi:hypothetical protein